MNARQALVCPSCGVLNRPTWEFCAKCGDSLEGATLTTTEHEDDEPGQDAPARVSGVPSTVVLGVAALAFAMLVAVAWRHASKAEPAAQPDPAMFTIATLPPDLPEAPPPPSTPGAEAFAEGQRLAGSGDLEGARDAFADAVGLDGSNPAYRAAYGRALWDLGVREQALSELGIAARLDPERQLAYARALDVAGNRQDAVEQYEEVLARTPEAAVVHEDLGRLLYRAATTRRPRSTSSARSRPVPTTGSPRRSWPTPSTPPARRRLRSGCIGRCWRSHRRRSSRGDCWPRTCTDRGVATRRSRSFRTGCRCLPTRRCSNVSSAASSSGTGRRAEAAEAYRRYAQLAPNAPDAGDLAERAARLEKGGATQ